jgi:hypothetical protein
MVRISSTWWNISDSMRTGTNKPRRACNWIFRTSIFIGSPACRCTRSNFNSVSPPSDPSTTGLPPFSIETDCPRSARKPRPRGPIALHSPAYFGQLGAAILNSTISTVRRYSAPGLVSPNLSAFCRRKCWKNLAQNSARRAPPASTTLRSAMRSYGCGMPNPNAYNIPFSVLT